MNVLNREAALDLDFERRFSGVSRLYGAAKFQQLQRMRICVIGVGGVGSWVVEACARSAVGYLTLIDLDHIAESNINRQIQANSQTLGQAKVIALAERIAHINPHAQVTPIEEFITVENIPQLLLPGQFDCVIDAIDDVRAKCALIDYCRTQQIRLITIGSAGGQCDPSQIQIRDLARTEQEPLLACVKKQLRQQYRFPRGSKNKFGIDAVFSTEPLRYPDTSIEMSCEKKSLAKAPAVQERLPVAVDHAPKISPNTLVRGDLNCAGLGSSVMVTAAFGLSAAAHAINGFLAAARF